MEFISEVLSDAIEILTSLGGELAAITGLTLAVSGTATLLGCIIGIPLGAALGLGSFRGRGTILVTVNTGMGFPPVLAGLVLLLLLWDDGPLGGLGILFTPAAMVLAQTLLAIPIAAGVTAATLQSLPGAAREQLTALRLPRVRRGYIAVREARAGVWAAAAAAFGRVVAEVGAVLIVGGNIRGETRVLTTAIVQESRQAHFGAAVALGIILLVVALAVNGLLTWLQWKGKPS